MVTTPAPITGIGVAPIVPVQILPIPPDTGGPLFPPETLSVWRFDSTLEDEVGARIFIPSTGSSAYTQFSRYELIPNTTVTRNGLKFEENKSYSVNNSFNYPDGWTVAFWWNSPRLVGFTAHATTKELEPKVAPIFAIGNPTESSSQTTLSDATIVITEIGYSKTQNAIRVYLMDPNGTDIAHVITSEPYSSGLRHVLATYIKSQGRFRIDIDGKTGILHSAPDSTSSLQQVGDFRINDVVPGYLAHKTTQTGGYLFDLLFTIVESLDNESLKAFRYGYEHITFDTLSDTRFEYFGIAYSQPDTVSTSHIFVDGGNIYAARSNGKIVKGARPIWDKEFNYENTQAVAQLEISQTDPVADADDYLRTVKWTNLGLQLKGTTVRI